MKRTVLTLCAAEGLTLIGVFAFPALVPSFRAAWSLSNTDAGWIAGIYFAGYAVAVPALTSLTDRIDAKRVFMAGAAICTIAALGFALFAQGLWTAMLFRFLGGVGLAGVYMPGLKALVDRVSGSGQARAMSYYTASFSMGTMLSFAVVGEAARWLNWQGAFALSAAASAAGLALAATLPPSTPHPATIATGALLDFRPVLRNRAAMGYILGYTCHMWELFSFRAWVVAFLVFAQGRDGAAVHWSPTTVATVCSLVAMLASLGGADLALRFDRRRLCAGAMLASGGAALLLGFTAALPYWAAAVAAVLYTGLVQIDSAALTTGAMLEADPARRGSTVALHSLLGFASAFFGPLALGAVLDSVGGGKSVLSWGLAFAGMGVVGLLGPLAL
ncbi:MAG TPA: MFS transporter, partial [Patescibacteria group bacterium]|nr:MFS transporter [Patescibacteria group bacterium]